MMKNKKMLLLTQGGLIAAVYVVLTVAFAPFSFGQVQVRLAEMLCILPLFTPAAIPGLFLGCLLGNFRGGALLPDVLFGSLATLAGAVGTYALRKKHPAVAVVPPIAANTIVVPLVLRYAYGIELPLWMMAGTVGLGEILSVGVLGLALSHLLERYRKPIFG